MKLTNRDLLRMLIGQKTSHRELARYVGCHHSMIDQLTSDNPKYSLNSCRPQVAVMIAHRLGVPVEALFDAQVPSAAARSAKSRSSSTGGAAA